jgi:hypothetical protein
MRQRTTITVDDFLWRRLKACVALEAKDMSAVIEQMIEAYLDEHEAAAREAANRKREES